MRILNFVFIAVMALAGTAALAETKIAVVNMEAAIFGSEVAKKREQELQKKSEFAQLQAKYESTVADIQALQKEAEDKSLTWSDDQKADYQKNLQFLRADIEGTSRKVEFELRALRSSIVKELQPKASEALQELVSQEGITLLVHREAVVWAKPELDVTAKLTGRLNSKTK